MAISIINLDSNSRKIFNKFSGSQEIYFLSHPVILQVATEQNDMLEQRSLQHQREVSTLKNKIKLCQRKLKDAELEESKIPALRAEFDVERQSMSAGMSALRRQLDGLSEQLSKERSMRSEEEKKNRYKVF